MKNKNTRLKNRGLAALTALIYILVHFVFGLGDFPLFKSDVGPKNFLPLATGLLLGVYGSAGTFLGALATGIFSGESAVAVSAEIIFALIMSEGGRLLWYSGKKARIVALKKAADFGRFMGLSFLLSAVCAGLGLLSGGAVEPARVFFSFAVWNTLLGIPVLILTTSIFCVTPDCPKRLQIKPDIDERLPLTVESIGILHEKIDGLCAEKKLDRKRAFGMQNCIEECVLLILGQPSCKNLWLTARVSDSISIVMKYDGERCNPLARRKIGDQLGLIIIKNRALRASHGYFGGVNSLHIVQ
ncbi:MAG: hypothetical protein LBR83_02925 [Clostridiales bacterium]|jgi:hypothetical protein|nr:hypothetical protein [Clostridiales bacterium]